MTARAVVALLSLAAAASAVAPLSAQEQTGIVTGVVTTVESGAPVPGALVEIAGTRLAQTTNEQGRFLILNVPVGTQTVTVQIIGFATAHRNDVVVTAGQTTTVDIALETTVLSIEELVATGVSQATTGIKAPFTIGRVSGENINAVPTVGSAVTAIQGKVAGVNIIRSSGLPGAGSNIQLRTPTGIQVGGGPMYVVDGVIMASEIGGTTVDLEALDIENIEIVKGAAAASLYGSRAAGGVIAITTKRGQSLDLDQTRITVRTELGMSDTPELISMSGSHPYLQNAQGQWIDEEGNVVDRDDRVLAGMFMDQPYRNKTYNNLEKFFRPVGFEQQNVSLSHRAESTNFLASATRFHQPGTLQENEGFTRNTFRLNLDHRLRSDFRLQISAQHSRYDQDLIYQGSSGEGGIFWDLLMFPVDVDIGRKGPDGKFLQQPDSTITLTNPLWYEGSREYFEKRARTIAAINAAYNPFQFLTVEGNMSYDRSDMNIHAYTPKGTSTSLTSLNESDGYLQKDSEVGDVFSASVQSNLTYNFGPLSTRTVARALIERENNAFVRATGEDFYVEGVPSLDVAATRSVRSSVVDIRSTGYSLDEQLDYAGKYILTGLIRRDGSSLFGPDERWQNYYRVAGAWIMSEEPWFPIDALTHFKLRYAIGTAGSRPNFSYQYETWDVSNDGEVSKNTLGNRDLSPAHTTEHDMGIDFIFNDRYSLQLTYAKQTTEGQITQLVLPAFYGYSNQWFNTGVQSGHTYEATLEAQLVNRPGFTWSMTAIADRSSSTIDEWNRACFISGLQNICGGASLFDMWGQRHFTSVNELAAIHPAAAGQFQVNDDGYAVWVGEGNDYRDGIASNLWGTSTVIDGVRYNWGIPIIENDADGFPLLQPIGSSAPDVNLGWLNNVFWKGFALHTHVHAQIGGHVYNATKQRLYQHERHGELDQAGRSDELKKPLDYYQAIYNRMNETKHFVEDGTYLKLRSVALQYRFNQDQLNRFGLGGLASGINLGANLRNVLTFTSYTGFDPEVGSPLERYDYFNYPNTRQLTLTAEITF